MKLKFTRKTWYFLLLASAAASMLNGFAVLSGTSFGLIEQIAFAAAGIAALFLAAEKGSASWEKRNFTGVFVLLMVSYMVNGWAGYLCSALAWPLLLSTEYKRGMAIQRQLQLVGAAEALHLFFLLMAKYGGMAALGFWTNLLWVLLACVIVLGTVLSFSLFQSGCSIVGSLVGSVLSSIEPVSSVVISVLFLHTAFTWLDLLGFSLILVTIPLMAIGKARES
jgi:drug/metabolite transporter (DMT)-like permease